MTDKPKSLSAFVPLPRAWAEWRHLVSPVAEILYVTMLLEMRPSTGLLSASVRELAASSKISRAATGRALDELLSAGFVRRLETARNGAQVSTYEVLFRRFGVPPEGQPPSRDRDNRGTANAAEWDSDGTARHVSPAETTPLDLSLDVQDLSLESPNPGKERNRVVTLEDLERES